MSSAIVENPQTIDILPKEQSPIPSFAFNPDCLPKPTELFEEKVPLLAKKPIAKDKQKKRRGRKLKNKEDFDDTKTVATLSKGFPEAKYPLKAVIAQLGKVAKGRQAKCKKCKKPIAVGAVRIGIQTAHYNMVYWKHLDCFCISRKFFMFDTKKIHNLSNLDAEDQQMIQDHFEYKTDASMAQLGKKKLKKLERKRSGKYTEEDDEDENEKNIIKTDGETDDYRPLTRQMLKQLCGEPIPKRNMGDILSDLSSVDEKSEEGDDDEDEKKEEGQEEVDSDENLDDDMEKMTLVDDEDIFLEDQDETQFDIEDL